jgi:hypothetical protein
MRPIALVGGVLVAATLVALLVVRELTRGGPPLSAAPPAPALDASPPTSADAILEVRATSGGTPVAGAEVRLYAALPAPAPGAPGFRAAGHGATGPDGAARLPAGPGSWGIAVRARGLASAWSVVVRAVGEGTTRVEIALAPAVTLEGRTLASDGGAPLPAHVTAIPFAGGQLEAGAIPPEIAVRSDAAADGTFRLEGLAPGAWIVEAVAADRHPARIRVAVPRAEPLALQLEPPGEVRGVVLRSDAHPAPGAVVRLASREHQVSGTAGSDGRFALRAPAGAYRLLAALAEETGAAPVAVPAGAAATPVEVRLGRAAAIEGVVREGGSERPVAGADVEVRLHETDVTVARVTAGPDGRCTAAGLAPGSYDVQVRAAGRSTAAIAGVAVGSGERFPLPVTLAGTGAVEGTVRDAADHPLAGVRVRVVARGDGLEGAPPIEARTGFDGRYRIDGLEIGRADLVVRQDGVALGAGRAVRIEERRVALADFVLPEPGVLAGQVTAATRLPPAVVIASPMRGGLGAIPTARAPVDAAGRYRLDLPAGDYRVYAAPAEAVATDLRVEPAFARVVAGGTERLDLDLDLGRTGSGAAGAALRLQVLEPGGAPSAGAVVTLARGGDDRVALATAADDEGRVPLAKDLGFAGAPVTLRARNGGRSGAWSGILPADGIVAVRLAPGASVEGAVAGPGGPVRGFTLEVASRPVEGGWRTLDVHRFAGARFHLGDLPAEPLRLAVRADDGRRAEVEVSLRPGEARALDLALGPRGADRSAPAER